LPVQQRSVSDSLHQFGPIFGTDCLYGGISRIPVTDAHFYFNQFVRIECNIDFGAYRGGETRRADNHDRLQPMSAATQAFLLSFIHSRYCPRP